MKSTGIPEALGRRAAAAAFVHGVVARGDGKDLVVAVDDPSIHFDALTSAFEHVRASLADTSALSIVIASPTTAASIAGDAAAPGGDDAWSRARAWARARATITVAPAVSHERLRALIDAAAAARLSPVVPDVATIAPALARVHMPRAPLARATLLVFALGPCAMPLFFVPEGRAPKGGLPKSKVDRIAEATVRATPALSAVSLSRERIVTSALAVLASSDGALSFRELLREARSRAGAAATDDAKTLASALHRLFWLDAVDLSFRGDV